MRRFNVALSINQHIVITKSHRMHDRWIYIYITVPYRTRYTQSAHSYNGWHVVLAQPPQFTLSFKANNETSTIDNQTNATDRAHAHTKKKFNACDYVRLCIYEERAVRAPEYLKIWLDDRTVGWFVGLFAYFIDGVARFFHTFFPFFWFHNSNKQHTDTQNFIGFALSLGFSRSFTFIAYFSVFVKRKSLILMDAWRK